MNKISFISTIHKEMGKCNSDALLDIIERIKPDVIFLEALESTYSNYEKMMFNKFNIPHQKLEIQAIQKYSRTNNFKYYPVLDTYLMNSFNNKFSIVDSNKDIQNFIDRYNELIIEKGFDLLNSDEAIYLEEKQRSICDQFLNNKEIDEIFDHDIDNYENSMLRNIESYCNDNTFQSAIFMCGVGHRKSIINKIKEYDNINNSVRWVIYDKTNH